MRNIAIIVCLIVLAGLCFGCARAVPPATQPAVEAPKARLKRIAIERAEKGIVEAKLSLERGENVEIVTPGRARKVDGDWEVTEWKGGKERVAFRTNNEAYAQSLERNPPQDSYTDSNYSPHSAEEKAGYIQYLTGIVKDREKYLANIKAGLPISWPLLGCTDEPLELGDIGRLEVVVVLDVVDKKRAVVRLVAGGKTVLAHFPTKGLIRGSRTKLDEGVWEVTGTANGEMFELTRADE